MENNDLLVKVTPHFEKFFKLKVSDSKALHCYISKHVIPIIIKQINHDGGLDLNSAPKIMALTCDWMEKRELLPVHMEMLHDRVLPELNRELFTFLQACYFRFKLGSLNFLAKTNDEQEEIHQRVLKSFEKREEYFLVQEECPPLEMNSLLIQDLSKDGKVYEFIVENWFPTKFPLMKKALLHSVAWHYKLKKNIDQCDLNLLSIPFLPKEFVTTILTFYYLLIFNKVQNKPKDVMQVFQRNFNYGVIDLLHESEIKIVKLFYLFSENLPTFFFNTMAEQEMFPVDDSMNTLINNMKCSMMELKRSNEENKKIHEKEIKNLTEKNKKIEKEKVNKEEQNKKLQEKLNKLENVVSELKKGNKSLDENNKKLNEKVHNLECKVSELTKGKESKDEKAKNLEEEITLLKNENSTKELIVSNIRNEMDDLKNFNSSLNKCCWSLIFELESRNRTVQSQRTTIENYKDCFKSTNKLLMSTLNDSCCNCSDCQKVLNKKTIYPNISYEEDLEN